MKEWEKNIKVLFEHAPQLRNLITKPVYYSNAPWAGQVSSHFLTNTGGSAGENFYRIVFKQGSPRDLMTIGSGVLAGLKTTSVVEKGRIKDVAGLELVDIPAASNLLPMLLTMGMFGAIQNRLDYISNVCADIRNRQIVGDHAKLERISEVILDCFESIPEMDQDMMRLNLARITTNIDDCHELLIIMRENLARESRENPVPYGSSVWQFVDGISPNGNRRQYRPADFLGDMLRHGVFAAYERFVAGKICQIILSGNYSPSNIKRSKQLVIRVSDTIRTIFDSRIEAHEGWVRTLKQRICDVNNGYYVDGWTLEDLEYSLARESKTIADIQAKIDAQLDEKLESFDFISRLANRDEIDVYIINGSIVIGEREADSPPADTDLTP